MKLTLTKIKQFVLSLGLAALLLVGLGLSLALAQGGWLPRRITTASAANRDSLAPRLNGDGTKIAFASDSDFFGQGIPLGQKEIWLYDTATMTLTRVTTASAADRASSNPSLSEDGTTIAFHSDSDFLGQGIPAFQTEIWLYNTATMTLTRITTASAADRGSFSPYLSGDGTKIAFYSDSDFLGQGIPVGQNEIWLYDTATMTLTRVTTASASDRDSLVPILSGDGTKIAFDSDSDFLGQGIPALQKEIWLYDTATMTLTRVTTASASDRASFPSSLSTDGTKIAFSSNSDFLGQGIPALQNEIWLYNTATMTLTRITTASAADRGSFNPSLSEDVTKIAFYSDSDFLGQGIPAFQTEIWLYDTATMTLTRITTASAADRASFDPSLSEDGTRIAFSSDSDFFGQGIPAFQTEIWAFSPTSSHVYLPIILR